VAACPARGRPVSKPSSLVPADPELCYRAIRRIDGLRLHGFLSLAGRRERNRNVSMIGVTSTQAAQLTGTRNGGRAQSGLAAGSPVIRLN